MDKATTTDLQEHLQNFKKRILSGLEVCQYFRQVKSATRKEEPSVAQTFINASVNSRSQRSLPSRFLDVQGKSSPFSKESKQVRSWPNPMKESCQGLRKFNPGALAVLETRCGSEAFQYLRQFDEYAFSSLTPTKGSRQVFAALARKRGQVRSWPNHMKGSCPDLRGSNLFSVNDLISWWQLKPSHTIGNKRNMLFPRQQSRNHYTRRHRRPF